MKYLQKTGICFNWTARVAGGLTVLFFLAALAGLLVSWRWIPSGCLLTVAGYAAFCIADKRLHLADPFALFLIVAALYATAWGFGRLSVRQATV